VNCSTLGIGTSNRKKRKLGECNSEKEEEKECIPVPMNTNVCILFNRNNKKFYVSVRIKFLK
jgi:hypothetical protein